MHLLYPASLQALHLNDKKQIIQLEKPQLVGGNQVAISVILLPLRPASLMHKNPQRCKIIHRMRPIGRKHRLIDLNMFLVEISCLLNFCGSYYGCCLMMHISSRLCYALK